jgi:hypothetical protein
MVIVPLAITHVQYNHSFPQPNTKQENMHYTKAQILPQNTVNTGIYYLKPF